MTIVDALTDISTAMVASRKLQNLTQNELARAARVSLSTVKALENHRGDEIGYTKLTRLLAVLGLELKLQKIAPSRPTLDELMHEDENER